MTSEPPARTRFGSLQVFEVAVLMFVATGVAEVACEEERRRLPSAAQNGDSAAVPVELSIPLHQGRYYSVHDFCRESNEKLGTSYSLEQVADRQIELTTLDRVALLLAQDAEFLEVDFHPDRLLLRIPDREDDRVRLRSRKRLEHLFGVTLKERADGKGLQIPSEFNPRRRSLLLIHGLESGPEALNRFQVACAGWGIQTLVFGYPNDGPPAWAGAQLQEELTALAEQHPGFRMAIVGHSLGGLVARYALETPPGVPGCVTDLFMLGSPHRGSSLSGVQDWIELFYEAIPGQLRPSVTLASGLGEAGDDLRPRSRFLKELNSRSRPTGVRYHVAIGTKGFGTDDELKQLTKELLAACRRKGVSPQKQDELRAFLETNEMRTGNGDGAVTVRSAQLRGAATSQTFDLNHLELISLPGDQPQDSELFRWIVDILRWSQEQPDES